MDKLPVVFRVDKEDDDVVVAFFPTIGEHHHNTQIVRCYMHIGQHACAHLDYYHYNTRPATPEEYGDLLAELKGIYESEGDTELVVSKRISSRMNTERIDDLYEAHFRFARSAFRA